MINDIHEIRITTEKRLERLTDINYQRRQWLQVKTSVNPLKTTWETDTKNYGMEIEPYEPTWNNK